MMQTLAVTVRDPKSSPESLRERGITPAVFYGHKEPATPIAVDARTLESIWKVAGETTIIKLTGAGDEKDTLIHEVQTHPVTGKLLHVDFYVLEKGKKIEIAVPLEFIGSAPAEKVGHIVSKALHELEIEVAPAELPHSLEVDISRLEIVGDHTHAGQIKLPPSAELKMNTEEIVVSITEFKEEKIEEPEAPVEGEAVPAEGESAPLEGTPAEGEKTE